MAVRQLFRPKRRLRHPWRLALTGSMLALACFSPPALGQDGRKSVAETYGDWTVNCQHRDGAQNGGEQPPVSMCQMSQQLRSSETGQLALAFVVTAPQTSQNSDAVIITPFGLKLSAGILVEVDGIGLLKAPFRTCLPSGCTVSLSLNEPQFMSLSNGQKATIVMSALNSDKPLRMDVSLNGFQAAHKRLDELAREFN